MGGKLKWFLEYDINNFACVRAKGGKVEKKNGGVENRSTIFRRGEKGDYLACCVQVTWYHVVHRKRIQ